MRYSTIKSLIIVVFALCLTAHAGAEEITMTIEKDSFGKTKSGAEVARYTLTNTNGLKAVVINYGAILLGIEVPDRDGNISDVTLGLATLAEYEESSPYFGAVVGRYANRIENGRFTLDGAEYKLVQNDGTNHLHGGAIGFDKVIWDATHFSTGDEVGVEFSYLSKDGDEGYPGNLKCKMRYTLTNNNELKFSYEAETDKPTVINLTQHSYWNLAGEGSVLDHELTINADKYTPVDDRLIPLADHAGVAGTPMDFTTPHTVGERIDQVKGGYDHNYVLNRTGEGIVFAARVYDPKSGRVMEVYTDQPGLQLYSGNFLDGTLSGGGGAVYRKHAAICLETDKFPNSPNRPDFPSVILRPGEKYTHETVHKFSTK